MASDKDGFIESNQYAREMRMQMENKELLNSKGRMYVGTGSTVNVSSGNAQFTAYVTEATGSVDSDAESQYLHYQKANSDRAEAFGWVSISDIINDFIRNLTDEQAQELKEKLNNV